MGLTVGEAYERMPSFSPENPEAQGTLQRTPRRAGGDLRIDDATKRFVVLPVFGNQAVLDKETQLLWQRQPNVARPWYAAMDTCLLGRIGGERAGDCRR